MLCEYKICPDLTTGSWRTAGTEEHQTSALQADNSQEYSRELSQPLSVPGDPVHGCGCDHGRDCVHVLVHVHGRGYVRDRDYDRGRGRGRHGYDHHILRHQDDNGLLQSVKFSFESSFREFSFNSGFLCKFCIVTESRS